MILKYPTGFYQQKLNEFISKTNLTFNISANPPPRSSIDFQKVPDGVAYRIISRQSSDRAKLGKLAFTVTNGTSTLVSSGQSLKQIGDFLEFTDLPDTTAEGSSPESINDISHDLAYYDFSKMGLSNDEVNLINGELKREFDSKAVLVNQLKTSISDTQIQIANLQKQVNDINSSITALLTANSAALSSIIGRLQEESAKITGEITALYTTYNNLNNELTIESNNLRSLGAFIK